MKRLWPAWLLGLSLACTKPAAAPNAPKVPPKPVATPKVQPKPEATPKVPPKPATSTASAAAAVPLPPEPATSRSAGLATRTQPPELMKPDRAPPGLWALQIKLKAIEMAPLWDDRRALIEDLREKKTRRYAVGDLLPRASLLISIQSAHVDILVADQVILRLFPNGKSRQIHRFKQEDQSPNFLVWKVVRPSRKRQRSYQRLLQGLRSSSFEAAHASAEGLLDLGEPALSALAEVATSTAAVAPGRYRLVGLDSERIMRPRCLGDLASGIIQQITGEGLGDPTRPGLSEVERARIRAAWAALARGD